MSVETIAFPFSSDVSKPVVCSDDAEIERLLQEYARKSTPENTAPMTYTRSSADGELPFFQCTQCLERATYLRRLRDIEEICDRHSIDDEDVSNTLFDLITPDPIVVHSFTLWTAPCDEQRMQVFLKTMQEAHGCEKNKWRESEKSGCDDTLEIVSRELGEKVNRAFRNVNDFGQTEIDAICELDGILTKIAKTEPIDRRAELNRLIDDIDVMYRDAVDKIDDVVKTDTYDESDDVVRDDCEEVYNNIDRLRTKIQCLRRYQNIGDHSEWLTRLEQIQYDLKKDFDKYEQSYNEYQAKCSQQ